MNKISGVYKITNTITGDFYIGSSKDIKKRWWNHKCVSRWDQHPNSRMYYDMAQYGLNNFIFEIIEETSSLKEREQYYIEQLQPSYNSMRANGQDTERYKQCKNNRYKVHRDEDLVYKREYCRKLCLYEGETLTLSALSQRLHKKGIVHFYKEAKKYLI